MKWQALRFAALVWIAFAPAALQAAAEDAEWAVMVLEKFGAKIRRDLASADRPVVAVNLTNTRTTDNELVHIKQFRRLEKLYLGATQITDAGLEQLRELPRLERLYLGGTQITDASLQHLGGFSIVELFCMTQ